MIRRRFTASYFIFYLILSEDTWRILAGFIAAVSLGPMVTQGRNLNRGAEIMVWLMIMAIGWSVSGWPAGKLTDGLKKAVKKASK
ncbi:MAG: hypothetical protein CSA23_05105 [Deltaproteobacteria bacterium]|nr:MAG: hypothetical protein CSA23_05105 [Deltaproteobacteria bacterium]